MLRSLGKNWSLSRFRIYHKLLTLLSHRKLKASNFANCKTITLIWSILVWCALRARIWHLECKFKILLNTWAFINCSWRPYLFPYSFSYLRPTQCVGYPIVLTSAVHNNCITASKEIRLSHQLTFLGQTCFKSFQHIMIGDNREMHSHNVWVQGTNRPNYGWRLVLCRIISPLSSCSDLLRYKTGLEICLPSIL